MYWMPPVVLEECYLNTGIVYKTYHQPASLRLTNEHSMYIEVMDFAVVMIVY